MGRLTDTLAALASDVYNAIAARLVTTEHGGDRKSINASIEALITEPEAAALLNVSRPICDGHEGFATWLEKSDRGAEAIRIMEARAARLGVTLPDVIDALKAEADRRGYRRLTVH